MNICPCELRGDRITVEGHEIVLNRAYPTQQSNSKIELGIRPEYLSLTKPGEPGLPVKVIKASDVGRHMVIRVALNNLEFNVVTSEFEGMTEDKATLIIDTAHANIYANDHLITGEKA
jgi:glycerol transport system ATP-binding protein